MTVFSKLSVLINGIQNSVDFSKAENTLSVNTLRITDGMSSFDLNSTLLNVLLNGGDASAYHHHDSIYYRKGEVDQLLSTESSARTTADQLLSGRLDVLEGTGEGSVAKAEADAKAYTDQQVAGLVDSAPELLNTLRELSEAIADDPNFATTIASQISSEAAARQAADTAEQTARITAVSDLQSQIDALDSGSTAGLAAEISRAQAAEATLQSNITAEANARQSAIASEQSARESADTALQAAIDNLDIDDLASVNITSAQDGDLWQFDVDSGKWINVAPLSEAATTSSVVPGNETLLGSVTAATEHNDSPGAAIGMVYRPSSNVSFSKFGFKIGRNANISAGMTVTGKIYQVSQSLADADVAGQFNPSDFTLVGTSTNTVSATDMALYPAVPSSLVYFTFDNVQLQANTYYILWAVVDGVTLGSNTANYFSHWYTFVPGSFPYNHYKQLTPSGGVRGDQNIALTHELYTGSAGSTSTTATVGVIKTNSSGLLDDSFLAYDVDFGGHKLQGVSTPTADTDAANKGYVDGLLSSEASARLSADQTLQSNLNAEASARQAADTTLQNNINAEASARASAISAEQSAREAADQNLQNQINAIDSGSSSAVAAEQAAREAADSVLQSAINVEKNRIDAILSAADADKDSFAEIVSLINSIDTENDSAFASYVLSNNAALASEASRLEGLISSEASTRASEITRVEGVISTKEQELTSLINTKFADVRATYVYLTNGSMSGVSSGFAVRVSSSDTFDLAGNATHAEAVGAFGVAAQSSTYGNSTKIQVAGRATVSTNETLVPGERVYLGTSGQATMTPPTADGTAVVLLGVACSSNEVVLNVQLISLAPGGSESGGGGGSSGGQPTISYMSAMQSASTYDIYWNASNVDGKYVQLQQYAMMSWSTVQNLGPASMGYGSAMLNLISDGVTLRLKLYDDSMYMMPTSPEVASSSWTASISSGGGGSGPTSITLGMTPYTVMMGSAYISWTASNAAGYPIVGLYEVTGSVPMQSFVKVDNIGYTSMSPGSIPLASIDPAKSYVIGLQVMSYDTTPSYWSGSFQIAEGTGGVSAVHSFNSVTVSSDNTTISWSVTGPTSGTVVGGGTSEVYVVLQKLENGNWAGLSYGYLGQMSPGSATLADALTPGTYRLKLIGDGGWYFEADGGYVYSQQFLVSEPVAPVVNSASFGDFNTFMGNDTVTVSWSAANVTSVQQALLQSYSAISDSWTEVGILGDANSGSGVISVSGLTGGAQYRVVVVPTFMDHTPLGTASSSITFTAPAKLTYVSTSQSGSSQVFNWSQSGAGSLYVGLEHETGPAIYGSPVILGLASLGTASVNIADLVDETNYRLALYSDAAGTMPVTSASVTVNGGKTQAFLVDFSLPATIAYVSNSASGSDQVINWTAANAAGLYVGLVNVATSTKTMLGSESDGTESVSQSSLTNGGSYVLRLFSDAGGNVAVDGSDTAQFTVTWAVPATLTYEGFGHTGYWDLGLYGGGFVRAAKFAATANQKLDKVSVNLRYKTPASGASVQLTLHTKSGSFLSAPIATSASVPTSSMVLSNTVSFGSHTGSYVDFEFDENQAPLQSGETYYVKITASASGENIFGAWYANSDLPSNLVSQTSVYFVDVNGANAVYNDTGHSLAMRVYTKPV